MIDVTKTPDGTVQHPVRRLQTGRVKCAKCNRYGVGYANHPHAFGYKDYSKTSCRYCGDVQPIDTYKEHK